MSEINNKEPFVFAVSGVKNSGKTTLIKKLVKEFKNRNLQVAVIKHDGHDFSYDVPNTDTYGCLESGAYATAIFSDNKYMVVKKEKNVSERQLKCFFPEADIIIIEGMKNSAYPKIEVIRKAVSDKSVCMGSNLLAIATDMTAQELNNNVKMVNINDIRAVADIILKRMKMYEPRYSAVILAGGKSSRMGVDKADLYILGKTFLEIQIDKLKRIGIDEIIVSGYKGRKCDVTIIKDELKDKGPLGGLYTCMKYMKNSKCLVIPVDVPFIPVNELKNLLIRNAVSDRAVTLLRHNDQIEPLIGVYSKDMAEKIKSAVIMKEYSAMRFIEQNGFDVYDSKENDELFRNINFYKEYLKIKRYF